MKREREYAVKRENPKAKRKLTYAPSMDVVVARKVKAALDKNTDWRCTDFSVQNNVVIGGTIVDIFANLTRGDSAQNNFEGNKIIPKWVQLRCNFEANVAYVESGLARWIVGQQTHSSGIPAAGDILEDNSTGYAAISAKQFEYAGVVYKILHDEMIPLPNYFSNGISINEARSVFIPGWKLGPTEFLSNTTGRLRGAIFSFVSLNKTPVAGAVTQNLYARVKFSNV